MGVRSFAVVLAPLCLLGVWLTPGIADGYRLGPAVTLGGAGVGGPSVAVSSDGRTVAAWERRGHASYYAPIVVRLGSVGRGWLRTETLAREGQGPLAAAGAHGTAAVVWAQQEPNGDSIVVSIASGHGRFSHAVRVARSSSTRAANGFVSPAGIEVQADGRIVVVWTRTLAFALVPIESAVEYATLTGARAKPHVGRIRAIDTETQERGVSIAQSESGRVSVAVQTSNGLAVSELPEGASSFLAPQLFAIRGGAFIESFGLSAGPGGAILAVALRWPDSSEGSPFPPEAWVSRPGPDGTFAALEPVLPAPARTRELWQPEDIAAAAPAGGGAVVAWLADGYSEREEQALVNGDEQEQQLSVAVGPSEGAPGEYMRVPPSRSAHGHPLTEALVLAAGGTAMVVWAQGAGRCTRGLYAAIRPAGGVFASAVKLTPQVHLGCHVAGMEPAGAAAGGYAIVGWVQGGAIRATALTG